MESLTVSANTERLEDDFNDDDYEMLLSSDAKKMVLSLIKTTGAANDQFKAI